MIWNRDIECMSRDEMRKLQDRRLIDLVAKVYNHVPFYKRKMDEIGVKPTDIKGIEDIPKLPFTYKQDLRDNYTFGLLAVPMKDIVRVHGSCGTTGKPTTVGYTRNDIENWKEVTARCFSMAGITSKDIVQVSYGYGLFTVGLGAH